MSQIIDIAKQAKKASIPMSALSAKTKNNALKAIANALVKAEAQIIEANTKDLQKAEQ